MICLLVKIRNDSDADGVAELNNDLNNPCFGFGKSKEDLF